VPLLGVIDIPDTRQRLMVMPFLCPFNNPHFQTFGEFVAFFTQISEVNSLGNVSTNHQSPVNADKPDHVTVFSGLWAVPCRTRCQSLELENRQDPLKDIRLCPLTMRQATLPGHGNVYQFSGLGLGDPGTHPFAGRQYAHHHGST
jgi:hypothetical protein